MCTVQQTNFPAPLPPKKLAKGEEEARWMPRVHSSHIMAVHRATILKKIEQNHNQLVLIELADYLLSRTREYAYICL